MQVGDLITVFAPISDHVVIMHVFVYLVCILLALSFAYSFTIWTEQACWQLIPVLATFILCWIYFALLSLCDTLKSPFASGHADDSSDRLNPEAIALNTDLELFYVMRQGFSAHPFIDSPIKAEQE